jgi:hypothetical protein
MTELNEKHRKDIRNIFTKEQKEQIEKMKMDRKKIADINTEARLKKMKLHLDMNDDQM